MTPHRLAVIGPMLGCHRGYTTFMGEILADLLERDGHSVIKASTAINRGLRFAEMATELVANSRRYDILILQVYSGLSFVAEDMASLIARRQGKRIIMHVHGGALPEFVGRHRKWAERVFSRAHTIVAPSAFLARHFATLGRTARVIPNVLEMGQYPYRRRAVIRPRLFWMRAFHEIYNPLMAVRVLERVKERYRDAVLVMAGQDKGMEAQVREEASLRGVRSETCFAGFLDPQGKARLGDRSDVFLNTNRIDNTPVSILEACAMGLPVVATKVGGISDLLTDGHSGLFVPDGDDAAMADAVARLVEERELAGELSDHGRALALESSWDTVRKQWARLFDEEMQAARAKG